MRLFRWALIPMTCAPATQPDNVNDPGIRRFSFRFEHIQLAMSAGLVQFLRRAESGAATTSRWFKDKALYRGWRRAPATAPVTAPVRAGCIERRN